MKIKVVLLSFVAGLIILSASHERGRAAWGEPKEKKEQVAQPSLKIGLVSIRKIFKNCKRNTQYQKDAAAEQEKLINELQKLQAEIEADKAGLKTRKPDSPDYQALLKDVLTKQAGFQAQQEFYKQQLGLKDKRWTEQLYSDILKVTGEIAEQKGLGLVLQRDEPDLPAQNSEGLMATITTHKVLYGGGCIDISDDVITRIDSE